MPSAHATHSQRDTEQIAAEVLDIPDVPLAGDSENEPDGHAQ